MLPSTVRSGTGGFGTASLLMLPEPCGFAWRPGAVRFGGILAHAEALYCVLISGCRFENGMSLLSHYPQPSLVLQTSTHPSHKPGGWQRKRSSNTVTHGQGVLNQRAEGSDPRPPSLPKTQDTIGPLKRCEAKSVQGLFSFLLSQRRGAGQGRCRPGSSTRLLKHKPSLYSSIWFVGLANS